MCPLIQYIKERGGEFSNIIIQRIRNPFWRDVFKHYKIFSDKCTPVTFDDFVSECLHYKYNVHVCRGRKVVCIKSWTDCGIVSVGQRFGPDGCLTYNAFRTRVPNAKAGFLLYEGVLSAIRGYQRQLGLDVEENFVADDSRVWKCIGKGNVKDIYAGLVANSDTPKCVDRWSKTLNTVIDTKYFKNIKSSRPLMTQVSDVFSTKCRID